MRISAYSVIEKAGIPDHRSMFDGLGFLLLQEIFFCRVLDIRVPEGVGVDVRKVVAFGKFGQPIGHAVRVHGFAVFLSENKIPVVPTITHSKTLFKL